MHLALPYSIATTQSHKYIRGFLANGAIHDDNDARLIRQYEHALRKARGYPFMLAEALRDILRAARLGPPPQGIAQRNAAMASFLNLIVQCLPVLSTSINLYQYHGRTNRHVHFFFWEIRLAFHRPLSVRMLL